MHPHPPSLTPPPAPHQLRCVHCHTTETPLWRAGPSGPKTLCNACGVRWKKTGSVIARSKRPSHPPPSHPRKRARSNPTPPPPTTTTTITPTTTTHTVPNASTTNTPQHQQQRHISNSTPPPQLPLPPPPPTVHPVIPLAIPKSVYRVTETGKAKYESVFSGLMNVHRRQDDASAAANTLPTAVHPATSSRRTRTQTRRGHAFFSEIASLTPSTTTTTQQQQQQQQQRLQEPQEQQQQMHIHVATSATSPVSPVPSVEGGSGLSGMSPRVLNVPLADREGGVYVTEVHAPSPSPSPPPMPRLNRGGGRGGFTLLLAAVADKQKVGGVGFRSAAAGEEQAE